MTSRNVAYYEQLAREYPLFFDDLESNMEEEGDWLDTVLRERGAHTVLDASCGSGRQSIPLARRGYRVTAADPCAAMLREARHGASQASADIRFYQAEFTDLPSTVTGRFDAVIALGNGLCHQEARTDIVASLRSLAGCCHPGGLCLVGIKDFDRIREERRLFHDHRAEVRDGEEVFLFQLWEFADPILVCTVYRLSGGEGKWSVHRAETREHMLGARDLEDVALEAGFTSVHRLDHPREAVYALT